MVRSNKQEPRVSSTYIKSLVKQPLSSSSPSMTTTTTTTTTDGSYIPKTHTHKKQVRRRLHTSRPYQDRLLNMAEARREIVTALKQHRASMRQASKIPPPLPPLPPQPPPPDPPLSFLLPNQPLGLNLNFNDFIETSSATSSLLNIYSSSSPSSTFAATSDSALVEKQMMMNNVMTSACWSELMMKTVMEPRIKPEEEVIIVEEDDVFPKLSDVMEYPSWLNSTDEELFHPYNITPLPLSW